jgi:hypothetical protein
MSKLPTDRAKAHAAAVKDSEARAAKRAAALERDRRRREEILRIEREFGCSLGDGKGVTIFCCRRGR